MAMSGETVHEVADTDARSAARLAIRNAFKLGASLIFTWAIALLMKIILPRFLGPSLFGQLNFADAFTMTAFVALHLGADTYIRKEVAVRPDHASDFFGGTMVLRTAMTVVIFAVMAGILHWMNRPPQVRYLVYIFALAQFFVNANATLSAILHAKGRVNGMSVLAVATKVVWAAGVLVSIAFDVGLWGYALSYFLSEFVETFILYWLAKQHVGLSFKVDVPHTKAMLVASLAYYLNQFAITAYGKLDVTLLERTAGDEEVGWYAVAGTIGGLTLLVTPLIGWVLMPMFARAASRSHDELFEQIRRSMELILTLAIPVSLMINVGADFAVGFLYRQEYAPAALALQILATMYLLTYVAIVYAITLTMLDRPWTLTLISIAGLVVNPIFNLLLIKPSLDYFGRGGGGAGCALAMVGTEIFVTTCMMIAVGRGAFDRRSTVAIGKSLVAAAIVIVVHRYLVALGPARLIIDGALYTVLVVSTGALRIKEIIGVAKDALRNRSAAKAAQAAGG
jgi:O-antigen/teichoic acid export membrane protein